MLPGRPGDFAQLQEFGPEVAIVFWSQIGEVLGGYLSAGSLSESSEGSVAIYHDYISRTLCQGGGSVPLTPDHPRLSASRSGHTASLTPSRLEYLKSAAIECAAVPARYDLVHAFIGFLEGFPLLRTQFAMGNTHWNVTGSIPRRDGGVTDIVQCYANGRICYEYRRLPDPLTDEYRQLTSSAQAGGWREVWIETLPLEKTMSAVRTIATKASLTELPVVR